jgi:hypothetical protein
MDIGDRRTGFGASDQVRQPAALVLVAYRHRIDLAAPDSFSIVLRAREREFGISVRSDRESADPRLSYHAPGAADRYRRTSCRRSAALSRAAAGRSRRSCATSGERPARRRHQRSRHSATSHEPRTMSHEP